MLYEVITHRSGEFKALAAQQRQAARGHRRACGEAGAREDVHAQCRGIMAGNIPAKARGDEQVLVDREMPERLRDLERAPDAACTALHRALARHVASVEKHRALVRAQVAGDQVSYNFV